MIVIDSIEQLAHLTGKEVGRSEWLAVTQDMISKFAEATGDYQWIHTDEQKAALSPFGSTIAHGFLLLSLLPALKSTMVRFDCAKMAINYGLDRVRFLLPVKAGEEVRLVVTLNIVEETSSGIKLFTHNVLEVKGGRKPAMTADGITLLVQ